MVAVMGRVGGRGMFGRKGGVWLAPSVSVFPGVEFTGDDMGWDV
jgi:hypothetical protein